MRSRLLLPLVIIALAFLLLETPVYAAGIEAVTVTTNKQGGQTYSVTIQILALMTLVDGVACFVADHDVIYPNHDRFKFATASAGYRSGPQ